MAAELLVGLIGANLAGSAGILVMLCLRRPIRRRYGAQVGCLLWIAPLLALTAALPAQEHAGIGRWLQSGTARLIGAAGQGAGLLLGVWLTGAVTAAAVLAARHARFLRLAASGRAGPAMVGVLNPRMVAPADFAQRFSVEERALIRAHERAHVARGDLRVNALAAGLVCLNWFNPLVHLAARRLRENQELACDAHVTRLQAVPRRRYAETLLKAQLVSQGSPLASNWTPGGRHPLDERIRMLSGGEPSADRRYVGRALVAGLAAAVAVAGWSLQPTTVRRAFAALPTRLVILTVYLAPGAGVR